MNTVQTQFSLTGGSLKPNSYHLAFVVILLLVNVVVFADNDIIKSIPPNVIFPHITVSQVLNTATAYNTLTAELKRKKIGNTISPLQYTELKAAITAKTKNNQEDYIVLQCAKETKGYYLRVVINVEANQTDRGTFELYDPKDLKLMAKVEAISTFGFSLEGSAKKIIERGTQKLFDSIKTNYPDLIQK